MSSNAPTGQGKEKQVVIVTGDFLHDIHLFEQAASAKTDSVPGGRVLRQLSEPAGAWRLHELISGAAKELELALLTSQQDPASPGPTLPRVFHLWQPFPPNLQQQNPQVWRVSRPLGCQAVEHDKFLAPPPPAHDLPNPRLLVIDDLALGFRHAGSQAKGVWPQALGPDGQPGEVLIKTSTAPDNSPLWRQLLKPPLVERLTVVLSAEALRRRGAAISRGLSWDRTLDDLDRELAEGFSANDLTQCARLVVLFGHEGVAVYSRPQGNALEFNRLLFDPVREEGDWRRHCPGRMVGRLSILAAALARHLLQPEDAPLSLTLGRALAALRAQHEAGFGHNPDSPDRQIALAAALSGLRTVPLDAAEKVKATFDAACAVTQRILGAGHPQATALSEQVQTSLKISHTTEPLAQFATAYKPVEPGASYGFHSRLSEPTHSATRSNLLRDAAGIEYEELVAKGIEIVRRGPHQALFGVPFVTFGRFCSADREEVERLHTLHKLLTDYRDQPERSSPLSLAVFGLPGTGKSFVLRELVGHVFPPPHRSECLCFNLAEFHSPDHLAQAFAQVRDTRRCGLLPVVFWDDFESQQLRWLAHFLVPMQDSHLSTGGLDPLQNRAVFLFSSGASPSLEALQAQAEANRALKAPDFISRLHGCLNLKGPNPALSDDSANPVAEGSKSDSSRREEPPHVLRRAILLRSCLRLYFSHLGDQPAVAAEVMQAFLCVRRYWHHARSLAAIVASSDLASATRFEVSALPPLEFLRLHVSDDFHEHLRKARLVQPALDQLAEAGLEDLRKAGEWTPPQPGNALVKPLLPRSRTTARRREEALEDCRQFARILEANLRRLGYDIRRLTPALGAGKSQFSDDELKRLLQMEHDHWLRRHLLRGFEHADKTQPGLWLHRRVVPFKALGPEDQKLERALIESTLPVLKAAGFTLVKASTYGPQV
jgi:hypothetical protein